MNTHHSKQATRAGIKNSNRLLTIAIGLLRFALASAFFSTLADRFGLWGIHGSPGVAWGDWLHFLAYATKLLWFPPQVLIPFVAWGAFLRLRAP